MELTISILVASILISMLMSLLTMALTAKANLDVQNRMSNESYIITEEIRYNIFQIDAQKFEVVTDTSLFYTIEISQVYEIGLGVDGVVYKNPIVPPITHYLTLDKTEGAIYYSIGDEVFTEDERISGDNIFISEISGLERVFELIDIVTVDCTENAALCTDAIIEINLSISIIMTNGTHLTPRIFRNSIIV